MVRSGARRVLENAPRFRRHPADLVQGLEPDTLAVGPTITWPSFATAPLAGVRGSRLQTPDFETPALLSAEPKEVRLGAC
jgi:hypothetical protein